MSGENPGTWNSRLRAATGCASYDVAEMGSVAYTLCGLDRAWQGGRDVPPSRIIQGPLAGRVHNSTSPLYRLGLIVPPIRVGSQDLKRVRGTACFSSSSFAQFADCPYSSMCAPFTIGLIEDGRVDHPNKIRIFALLPASGGSAGNLACVPTRVSPISLVYIE
jgi:hypothetical protein